MSEVIEKQAPRKLLRYTLSALVLLDGNIEGSIFAMPAWNGKAESFDRMREALISELAFQRGWEVDRVDVCITSFVQCWGEDAIEGDAP